MNRPAAPLRSRRGAALVVALIMLVVVALLGLGAVQSSVAGLRVTRNAQFTQQAHMAAQRAIDQQMTLLTTFTGAATAPLTSTVNIDVDNDGSDDFSVVVDRPRCIGSTPSPGYSYLTNPPRETNWVIRAVATESGGTGATAEVSQGVRVRLPTSADCPA